MSFVRKGVYSKLEKIIGFCVLAMVVSFAVTVIGIGGPDWGKLGKGVVSIGYIPIAAAIPVALGFVSTNAAATTGIYGTYLGKEKKWKKEDLFNGVMQTDALAHVIAIVFIEICIVITGAKVLFPTGNTIRAPGDLALLLVPVMGVAAKYIMGFAIWAAAFSSLIGTTQRTAVLFLAGLGKPCGLEDKQVRIGSLIALAFGLAVAFIYGRSPTELILIANICTSVATPFCGLFMVLLIWRKDIGSEYKPPVVLKWAMLVSYIFVIIMTLNTINSLLGSPIKFG